MESRIWKYELEITDTQIIEVPRAGVILSVANQNNKLCLWAMVEIDRPLEKREIEIIGTGNPIEMKDRHFIGTVLIDPFVWHVFEIRQ
jgi:hypothetical protein